MIEASTEANSIVDPIFDKIIISVKILTPTIKAFLLLKHMPYIYHLVRFEKNQAKIELFLDFGKRLNVMTLVYVAKLGFKI